MNSVATPLSLQNLRKRYNHSQVLKDVSFEVGVGDIVLLLGANGAGKSTLMRICIGLTKADSGSAVFSSKLNSVGYLGHETMLYEELTVKENIEFYSKLRRIAGDALELLDEWGIREHADKRLAELSKGLKAKAAICAALMHKPRYIFLDEPTSALDEDGVKLLLSKLHSLTAEPGGFAIIATHDIERLKESANRLVVLTKGAVGFDSSVSEGGKEAALEYYRRKNR